MEFYSTINLNSDIKRRLHFDMHSIFSMLELIPNGIVLIENFIQIDYLFEFLQKKFYSAIYLHLF